MGNNSVSDLQHKYFINTTELYNIANHPKWNLLSLEVQLGGKEPTTQAIENITDKLEAIALRNHKLHKRQAEEDVETARKPFPQKLLREVRGDELMRNLGGNRMKLSSGIRARNVQHNNKTEEVKDLYHNPHNDPTLHNKTTIRSRNVLNDNRTEQEGNRMKTVYQLKDDITLISGEETQRANIADKEDIIEESVIQVPKVNRLSKSKEIKRGSIAERVNKSRNVFNPNKTELTLNDKHSRNALHTNMTDQHITHKENFEEMQNEKMSQMNLKGSNTIFCTIQNFSNKYYCGAIYRCHGNTNIKCIKRIAEAYEDDFCYFKTNYSYWQTFPLLAIKYEDIAVVRCIKSGKKVKFLKHVFEIELKKNETVGTFSTDTKSSLRDKEQKTSKGKIKKHSINNINFNNKEQVQSYLEYIKRYHVNISKRYELHVRDIKEERILLGTDTMEECEKWVGLLSWLSHIKNYT
jgi:hypothetical protein